MAGMIDNDDDLVEITLRRDAYDDLKKVLDRLAEGHNTQADRAWIREFMIYLRVRETQALQVKGE